DRRSVGERVAQHVQGGVQGSRLQQEDRLHDSFSQSLLVGVALLASVIEILAVAMLHLLYSPAPHLLQFVVTVGVGHLPLLPQGASGSVGAARSTVSSPGAFAYLPMIRPLGLRLASRVSVGAAGSPADAPAFSKSGCATPIQAVQSACETSCPGGSRQTTGRLGSSTPEIVQPVPTSPRFRNRVGTSSGF